MSIHHGSCHCGAVQFEIDADIRALVDCNCSICTKKGIVHVAVADGDLRILSGKDDLALYQFGSSDASHWFCRHCGIHPFGRPRNHPDRYTVNARCLDDYDAIVAKTPMRRFDGRNHPKDHV